jgi:hypothetical protein
MGISHRFAKVIQGLRKEIYILWAISVVIGLVILSLSFYFSPNDVDNGVFSFLSIPHDHCPLCGMSHSFTFMSRGDFQQAWFWNPGGPVLYALLSVNSLAGLVVATTKTVATIRKNKKRERRVSWE